MSDDYAELRALAIEAWGPETVYAADWRGRALGMLKRATVEGERAETAERERNRLGLITTMQRATIQSTNQRARNERTRAEKAEADARALAEALDETIEFAMEGWAYASDYFREKWDYEGQLAKAHAALATYRGES